MPEEIGLFAETGNDMGHTHEAPAAGPASAPQLVFGSAEEFLHEQLLPTYVRDVDDRSAKWCMEWYFHPEAVSRVEAMWRAWEHLRLDGATGVSVWWRDHADHHMRVLMDPQGPFYNCDKSGHRDPAHLESKRAPEGWFPDVSETKHRAVRTAIDACVARGTTESAAGIARKAAVTETFLYRHESEPCALCAQVFDMGPVGYLRTQMARILDSRDAHTQEQGLVTAATTRADLANSRAANHRLQKRLQSLERRLGEVLGRTVQDNLPELDRLAQDIDPASEKRIRELSARAAALQQLLAERDEELDAVRRLNTDLTRRLNATAKGTAP